MKLFVAILAVFFLSLSIHAAPTVRVSHVSDGDSFILSTGERVRMIGINAPELAEKFGPEAKRHLEDLIRGKSVQLDGDPQNDDRDVHGRLLRFVTLDGVDINRQMIVDGWAYAFLRYPFAKQRRDEYRDAESSAKAAKIGIWVVDSGEPESPQPSATSSPLWLMLAGAAVLAVLLIAAKAVRRRRV
jgi:endonuclease YncB( thermonuclease family)